MRMSDPHSPLNALFVEDLERRCYEILVHGRQIKLAKLIADAVPRGDFHRQAEINAAVDLLVKRTDIQLFGDYHNWRHSEIRRDAIPDHKGKDR